MAEEKKKGFLGKLFGRKSKEDKKAAEAAERAAQQKLVDEQMAARMAAINAAALKSAREQDEAAGLVEKEPDVDVLEENSLDEGDALEKSDALEKVTDQLQPEKDNFEQVRLEEAHLEEERLAQVEARAEVKRAEGKRVEAERIERERLETEMGEAEQQDAEKLAAEQFKAEEQVRHAPPASEPHFKNTEAEDIRAKANVGNIKQVQADVENILEPVMVEPVQDVSQNELVPKTVTVETQTKPKRKGFLERITAGLKKSTTKMSENIAAVFTKRKLDDEALEELEDLLIQADFGIGPASRVISSLAKDKFDKEITDMEIKVALADVVAEILQPLEKPIELVGAKPEIMLFVGVNGAGKTTTLGKLAKRYADQGKKVLIVAGDTFRAAADEQLKIWGERAGAPVMSASKQGADAASLVFDAITKARHENYDLLMIDTAGRLQNRTELMEELAKIVRVMKKQDESAPHHSLLVLDATVGQNALSQAEAFKSIAGVSGLVMTKLDGTAKGGVLVALSDKYQIPIHAIGIGERIEDLENFSASVFAAALSGVSDVVT